jgi:hypothetical protein
MVVVRMVHKSLLLVEITRSRWMRSPHPHLHPPLLHSTGNRTTTFPLFFGLPLTNKLWNATGHCSMPS